jgi:hypothetical protein
MGQSDGRRSSWRLQTVLTFAAPSSLPRLTRRSAHRRLKKRLLAKSLCAIRYVVENPARAGLKNWTWVWNAGWEARATAGREAGATSS